jgi:hypothetical protein
VFKGEFIKKKSPYRIYFRIAIEASTVIDVEIVKIFNYPKFAIK